MDAKTAQKRTKASLELSSEFSKHMRKEIELFEQRTHSARNLVTYKLIRATICGENKISFNVNACTKLKFSKMFKTFKVRTSQFGDTTIQQICHQTYKDFYACNLMDLLQEELSRDGFRVCRLQHEDGTVELEIAW